MPTPIILPQWGMGMNDGQVMKWLKSVGDPISKSDNLVEIESSKVNAEVESTADGTLGRIDVEEGRVVDVGTTLGYILLSGETEKDLPVLNLQSPETSPPVELNQKEAVASGVPQKRKVITPRARRLANQLNIDIDAIDGTGPSGRITEDDVKNAQSGSGATQVNISDLPVEKVVKLERLRATIARRMTESASIPTVTLNMTVDVNKAVEFQKRLVSEWRKHKLRPQYQDLVLKATARALCETQEANAHLVDNEIRFIKEVNIGVAMAVKDGLIVPVVKNADKKTLLEIATEVRDLAKKSRANSITVDEMSGSTFSVTTLESFGIEVFNPLLNPPEIGILGVGSVDLAPLFEDEKIVPRSVGHLNLTFDHRAWDGAPAANFLKTISKYISDPSWMDE